MHHIPQIVAVMTPFPHHIDARDSLGAAEALMERHNIRHLPVMENEDIVGIVSDRDLKRVTTLGHHPAEETDLMVGDLCSRRPYLVDVADPLDKVLSAMAEKRIGAVLVLKEGELAGIFTATDACRILAETLTQEHPAPGSGDDVA